MSNSGPVRNSINLAAAAALVVSICAFPAQAHESSALNFSSDGHQISIRGEGESRRYQVDDKVFYWNDLNASQKARLAAIEKRLEAAEARLDLDSDRLEQWADKMDRVAQKMEQELEGFEEIEIMFDSDPDHITFGDLERMAAKLEKQAAKFEKRIAIHEQELRSMESRMPVMDAATIRQLESEAHKMEKILREIAAEI